MITIVHPDNRTPKEKDSRAAPINEPSPKLVMAQGYRHHHLFLPVDLWYNSRIQQFLVKTSDEFPIAVPAGRNEVAIAVVRDLVSETVVTEQADNLAKIGEVTFQWYVVHHRPHDALIIAFI